MEPQKPVLSWVNLNEELYKILWLSKHEPITRAITLNDYTTFSLDYTNGSVGTGSHLLASPGMSAFVCSTMTHSGGDDRRRVGTPPLPLPPMIQEESSPVVSCCCPSGVRMPSASSAKLVKQASTEAPDPLRQGIIVIEHKIRNLEKRKVCTNYTRTSTGLDWV